MATFEPPARDSTDACETYGIRCQEAPLESLFIALLAILVMAITDDMGCLTLTWVCFGPTPVRAVPSWISLNFRYGQSLGGVIVPVAVVLGILMTF